MNAVKTTVKSGTLEGGILCVIDFSQPSEVALRTALTIAESTKSSLTVLYPYRLNQPRGIISIVDWKRTIELEASDKFTQMTNSLLKESTVVCEFKPEVGFVDDRIEAFTQKHKVRVIVLAAELARNSDGAFMDLMDRLVCPLLIVPKNLNQ